MSATDVKKRIDLLVVCSPGGHFDEARSLIDGLHDISIKYAIHDLTRPPDSLAPAVIHVPSARRDLSLLRQFVFAVRCLIRERPTVVLSTGANIGVTFGLAAKLLRMRVVFVESPTRILRPSLSCRLAAMFADRVYVRHEQLQSTIGGAIYVP